MERKSSKEYSVVFLQLVEGEKFKLLNLPSWTSFLLSVLFRTRSIQHLSSQHFAAILTPNIAELAPFGFSVPSNGFCGGPNTFSRKNTSMFMSIGILPQDKKKVVKLTSTGIISVRGLVESQISQINKYQQKIKNKKNNVEIRF